MRGLAATLLDPPPEMTPRRVLLTADAVGGVWTYVLDLAGGLAGRGVRTTLAVLGPAPSAAQLAAARAVPGLDVVALDHELDWTAADASAIRAAGQAVAALGRAVGADLIHLNSPALAAGVPFGAPVVAICHSCVRTWWAAVRGGGPLPPDLAWRADLTAEGYAAADILVAPSRAFARATAAAYGLGREPTVVHNGRPPTAPGTSTPPHAVALTAGRLWDEGKNVALLDAAAGRLGIPALAAGATEGPNGARIALRHIRPLGQLDPPALAARLAGRPIFVAPCFYEPFGLAVVEAAGHGCPLVLSDIPSFRELWDGVATFVPVDDPGALAAAVEALAADPQNAARAGAKAAARAASYDVESMAAGTVGVYRAVLAGRHRSASAPAARLRSASA